MATWIVQLPNFFYFILFFTKHLSKETDGAIKNQLRNELIFKKVMPFLNATVMINSWMLHNVLSNRTHENMT